MASSSRLLTSSPFTVLGSVPWTYSRYSFSVPNWKGSLYAAYSEVREDDQGTGEFPVRHHFRQNAVNGLLEGDIIGGQFAYGRRFARGFSQQVKCERSGRSKPGFLRGPRAAYPLSPSPRPG